MSSLPKKAETHWLEVLNKSQSVATNLMNSIETRHCINEPTFLGSKTRRSFFPQAQLSPDIDLYFHHYQHLEVLGSPIIEENVAYYGTDDGFLIALDLNQQVELWRCKTGSLIRSCPLIVNDNIYIGSFDKNVYCINKKNGYPKWKFKTGDWIFASPLFIDGLIIFGSLDHCIYAVEAMSGQQVWKVQTKGWVLASPTFWEGKILNPSRDGNIYIINSALGILEDIINIGSPIHASIAVKGDHAFLASVNNEMICYHLRKKSILWKHIAKKGIVAAPFVSESSVIFASRDGFLYCYHSGNGRHQWETCLNAPIISSPAGNDKYIISATDDGNIVLISVETGEIKKQISTGQRIRSTAFFSERYGVIGGKWLFALK